MFLSNRGGTQDSHPRVPACADWIKVTATVSVQGERARETQLTREELATIVDEAALRGCSVMVHAHDRPGLASLTRSEPGRA